MLLLLSTTVKAQQTTTNSSTPNHPKVALVLGGGGAKGAAEVGVLKYIEQSEVPIDMIVGTSIGSIIGGLYSVGYRAQQLDSLFRSQEWTHLLTDHNAKHSDKIFEQEDGVTYFMGFPLNAKQKRDKTESRKSKFQFGMLRGDSIESLLSRMTALPDSIDFNTLPIPLRCVAVDISTLQEVVIQSGNLPRAMRASMAIPLAFKPVNIGGRTLIDGGVMNNLPVDIAKDMGADIVIAIDLTVNKHETSEDESPWEGIANSKWKLGGLLKWAIERPDRQKYNINAKAADIYINPKLNGYSATDFKPERISEMIKIGEDAGKQALKELKTLWEEINIHNKK